MYQWSTISTNFTDDSYSSGWEHVRLTWTPVDRKEILWFPSNPFEYRWNVALKCLLADLSVVNEVRGQTPLSTLVCVRLLFALHNSLWVLPAILLSFVVLSLWVLIFFSHFSLFWLFRQSSRHPGNQSGYGSRANTSDSPRGEKRKRNNTYSTTTLGRLWTIGIYI